jgi:two-component system LytT family sensor kinase
MEYSMAQAKKGLKTIFEEKKMHKMFFLAACCLLVPAFSLGNNPQGREEVYTEEMKDRGPTFDKNTVSIPKRYQGEWINDAQNAHIFFQDKVYYFGALYSLESCYWYQDTILVSMKHQSTSTPITLLLAPRNDTLFIYGPNERLPSKYRDLIPSNLFYYSLGSPDMYIRTRARLGEVPKPLEGVYKTRRKRGVQRVYQLSATSIAAGKETWRIKDAVLLPKELGHVESVRILAMGLGVNDAYLIDATYDQKKSTWKLTALDYRTKRPTVLIEEAYKEKTLRAADVALPAILLGLLGVLSWLLLKYWRLRQERARARLQLGNLRAQLNPHFLFNAMTSIQALVNRNDNRAANQYLGEFSRLLRSTLDRMQKETAPVQEELDALRTYCALEALRTPFEYHIEVEPGIDIYNAEIPTMLLQPLVENAILHGLRQGGVEAPRLEIRVKQKLRSSLCIAIDDNGIGIDAAGEQKSGQDLKRNSYGLAMTRERIKLLNQSRPKNKPITLDIRDKRHAPLSQRGTIVAICIPDLG